MDKYVWLALAALFFVLATACILMGAIAAEQLVVALAIVPAFASGWCAKAASWSA